MGPIADPRIASLLPAGTEIVAALGAGHLLVGISHECDYPPSVTRLPRLTGSPIDATLSSASIDQHVRALRAAGRPVIAVDGDLLREARPDLILTQGLCEVCAVVEGDVRTLAQTVSPAPRVLPLTARTLPGIFMDIETTGRAIGREGEALALNAALDRRLRELSARAEEPTPRVVVVEWLEPLYLAGHWVPEMVAWAGGDDVGAAPGEHSHPRSWREVAGFAPDLIVVALCGFGLERAVAEWRRFLAGGSEEAAWAGRLDAPIWAIDGNAYTSRPGPRTVDGAELLQQAIVEREASGLVRLTGPAGPRRASP